MTLLSICQNVADRTGLPRPSAIAASSEQLNRQLFGFAKEVLDELGRKNWPVLQVEHSFSTVAGTADYALPAAWKRSIADTAYLSTEYYALRGSMTPAAWQQRRNELPSQIGRYNFRIYGNPLKLFITPTPSTVETVLFEYITKNKAASSGAVAQENFQADTDTTLLPEALIEKGIRWRIKHAKGLDYSEDFNDYEQSVATEFAQALALGSVPVAYRNVLVDDDIPYGYAPESGFG